MTNLYEEGKFGGIPKAIFDIGEDNKADDLIFVCELIKGYTDTDEEGYPYSSEDSETLIIDNQKIPREIDSDMELKRTMRTKVFELLCSYLDDSQGLECSFGTLYPKPNPMLIAQYLQRDFERMMRYNKPHSRKADIIRELELDFKELTDKLIDLYSPESVQEQKEQELLKKKEALEQYDSNISERIEELERELEELKTKQRETREDLDKTESELQTIEEQEIDFVPVRASKNAVADGHIKELENIRQELKNATQGEESSIPEEIQRKARYFLDKGYIEEWNGHYFVVGFTGQEIAWINKYKLKDLGKDYFTINEMALYIWKNKAEPYKKSNFTSLKTPNKQIAD